MFSCDSYSDYDNDNNITRIFYNDSRDKKVVARGSRNKNPKKRSMALMTPSSYLKGKDRKDYMKASEVVVKHIYDEIENVPKLEELISSCKTREEVKEKLTLLKSKHTVQAIRRHLNLSAYSYYKLFKEYGVSINEGTKPKKKTKVEKEEIKEVAEIKEDVVQQIPSPVLMQSDNQVQVIEPSNDVQSTNSFPNRMMRAFVVSTNTEHIEPDFSIKYNKQEVLAKDISSKLTSICGVLDEDKKYKVSLLISEL